MKNTNIISILVVVIILGTSKLSFSQYLQLLQNDARWHVYHFFESSCNETYQIIGDSLINGHSYKIVKADPFCYDSSEQITLLREDTAEKKIYQLRNATEYLIYNFDIDIGDTINYTNPYSGVPYLLVLNSIADTLPVENLSVNILPLKVYFFSESPPLSAYKVVWVEGLGSLSGLLMSGFPWGGGIMGETLLCHFKPDGTQDFHYIFMEEPSPCEGPILGITDESENNKVEIYPNPCAMSEIKIQGKNISLLEFTDINGQTVSKQKHSEMNNTITVNEVKPGFYFLKVTFINRQYIVKKFIKI